MRPAFKTARLLFLFFLISPLYAQPFPEPEPDMTVQSGENSPPEAEPNLTAQDWSGFFNDWLFFEELFVFEDTFSIDESLMSADALPDEEVILPDEETLLSEETIPEKEISPNEETLLSEDTLHDEEPITDEQTLLAALEESDDDPSLDEDAFFFEAPPLIFVVPKYEIRSLDAIFPNLSVRQRIMVMNREGLKSSFVKGESPSFIPNPDYRIDLLGSVMKKNPSHLIEALAVVPYNEKEFDLLDIYNALGRIEKIKDQSVIINRNDFYIFTESTRIESTRNRKAISDPLPAVTLPFSETIYLRLKEITFGNLFIRADVSISMYGITYSMTNFTDVRYFLIPIMRAERYITIIYLEPVKEGILIYSMSGFYLPGFIADRVNLTPNINRRIEVFINWITEGLRKQESAASK